MLTKNRKIKRKWFFIIIAILIVVFTSVILLGAFGDSTEYFTAPSRFVDTNIETIKINAQYFQGGIDFQLERIEAGDKYTILYFNTEVGTEMITGVRLYSNNEELKYSSAGTSTYRDSYIIFEPLSTKENLEIRIQNVLGYNKLIYEYPLVFKENVATVIVDINDVEGQFIVTLKDEGIDISNEGLQSIFEPTIAGYPVKPTVVTLTKNGEEIRGEYSNENIPDAIIVTVNNLIFEDSFFTIPLS